MSHYPPGSFITTDRIMNMHVEAARREALAQRLREEASAARPRSRRVYGAVLASLGQRLAAWGASLQKRYSAEESRPTPARAA